MNNTSNGARRFFAYLVALIAAAIFALLMAPADAASFRALADIQIDVFNTPNDFVTSYGLSNGDTVSVNAIYDDTNLAVRSGDPSNVQTATFDFFDMQIGSLSLTKLDDLDCCSEFPAIQFEDGVFRNFLFLAGNAQGDGSYEIVLEDFLEVIRGPGSENLLVVQNTTPIDFSTVTITQVPVPAALPLLGSALGAMLFLRRRRC